MNDKTIIAQIAALPDMSTGDLRAMWQELYKTKPPLFNKTALVNRLSYRIQELHYGGISGATRSMLAQLASESVGKATPRKSDLNRPVPGTRLLREFRGEMHTVSWLFIMFLLIVVQGGGTGIIVRIIKAESDLG